MRLNGIDELIGLRVGWECVLRGLGEEFQGFMSAELELCVSGCQKPGTGSVKSSLSSGVVVVASIVTSNLPSGIPLRCTWMHHSAGVSQVLSYTLRFSAFARCLKDLRLMRTPAQRL